MKLTSEQIINHVKYFGESIEKFDELVVASGYEKVPGTKTEPKAVKYLGWSNGYHYSLLVHVDQSWFVYRFVANFNEVGQLVGEFVDVVGEDVEEQAIKLFENQPL